ncbi:MAG: MucBP domain-containing protein, partial [Clostridiales bacterium]|nr:MucBP domain-containing protein [Clostridiales bacterium]
GDPRTAYDLGGGQIVYEDQSGSLVAKNPQNMLVVGGGGPLTLTSVYDATKPVTMTRAAGFEKALFNIVPGGDLILENIIIDGGAESNVRSTALFAAFALPEEATIIAVVGGGIGEKEAAFRLRNGAVLQHNAVTGNGGAIHMTGDTAWVYVEGGLIKGNTATGHGGAIYMTGGTLEVSGGLITGNLAGQDRLPPVGDALIGERNHHGDAIYYGGGRLHVLSKPGIGADEGDNGVYLAVPNAAFNYIYQYGDLLAGSNINIEDKVNARADDKIVEKIGGTANLVTEAVVNFSESGYYRWTPGGKLKVLPFGLSEYKLVNAAHLYVASYGIDTNPGTIDYPFKTIETAFRLAGVGIPTYVHVMDNGVTMSGTARVAPGKNITLQRWTGAQDWDIRVVRESRFTGAMIDVASPTTGYLVPGGFTLRDITLDGGSYRNSAPVVTIASGSEMQLMSGAITNNNASSGLAAAVSVAPNAGLYMLGGSVSGNESNTAAILLADRATFVMQAGSINENLITGAGGGAVLLSGAASSFTMTGGEISRNTGAGYGVHYTAGKFTVAGDARVESGRTRHGVYMGASQVMYVEGDLSRSAYLEVSGKAGAVKGTEIAVKQSGAPVSMSESRRFYWEPRNYSIIPDPLGTKRAYVLDEFVVAFIDVVADGREDLVTTTKLTLIFDDDIGDEIAGLKKENISVTPVAANTEINFDIGRLTKVSGVRGVYELELLDTPESNGWLEDDKVDVSVKFTGIRFEPALIEDVRLHRLDEKLVPGNQTKETLSRPTDEPWATWARDQAFVYAGSGILRYRIGFTIPESYRLNTLEIQDFIPTGLALASPILSDCVTVFFVDGGIPEYITDRGTLMLRYNGAAVSYVFNLFDAVNGIDVAEYRGMQVYMEIDFKLMDEANPPDRVQNYGRILVNNLGVKENDEVERPNEEVKTLEQTVYYRVMYYLNNGKVPAEYLQPVADNLRLGDRLTPPKDADYGNGRYEFDDWYTKAFPPGPKGGEDRKDYQWDFDENIVRGNMALYAAYEDILGMNAAKETFVFAPDSSGDGEYAYGVDEIIFSEAIDPDKGVKYRIGFTISQALLDELDKIVKASPEPVSLELQDIMPPGFKPMLDNETGINTEDLKQCVDVTIVSSDGTSTDVTAEGVLSLEDDPLNGPDSIISFTFNDYSEYLLDYLSKYVGGKMYMEVTLALIDDVPVEEPWTAVNRGRILVLVDGVEDETLRTDVATPEQSVMYDVTLMPDPLSGFETGLEPIVLRAPYGGMTNRVSDPSFAGYVFLGWYMNPENERYSVGDKPPEDRLWVPGGSRVIGPVTAYALWYVAHPVTVQYRNRKGEEIQVDDVISVADGREFTIDPPLIDEYTYVGWLQNADESWWAADPPKSLTTTPISISGVVGEHTVTLVYGQDKGGNPDRPGADGKEDVTITRNWTTTSGAELIPPKTQVEVFVNIEDKSNNPYRAPGGDISGYTYVGYYKVSPTEIKAGSGTRYAGGPYEPLAAGVDLYVTYVYEKTTGGGNGGGDEGDGGGGGGSGDGGGPVNPGDGDGDADADGDDDGDGSGRQEGNEGGEVTPGGKDKDVPPNPSEPGNILIPAADNEGYLEYRPGGELVGEWRWNEETREWEFTAAEPTGNLPGTGDPSIPLFIFLGRLSAMLLCALGVAAVLWATRRKRKARS